MYISIYQIEHTPTWTGKSGSTRTNIPDLYNRFAKAQHDKAFNTAHTISHEMAQNNPRTAHKP